MRQPGVADFQGCIGKSAGNNGADARQHVGRIGPESGMPRHPVHTGVAAGGDPVVEAPDFGLGQRRGIGETDSDGTRLKESGSQSFLVGRHVICG